jgi:hypothetical protein
LLTTYGRALSKELLSTWSGVGEQEFAYGKISSDEKNILGAFVRGVQTRREDANSIVGRAIPMQMDFDVALKRGDTTTVLSVGRQEVRSGQVSGGRLFSRRHYIIQQIDDEITWRIGKFSFSFGLGDPNHTSYVRKDLSFAYDSESYNLEYSYLSENLGAYFTAFDAQLTRDSYMLLLDRGAIITVIYPFWDRSRLGLSFYDGESDLNKRRIIGPWYVLSFTERLFWTGELDYQHKTPKSGAVQEFGWVTTQKLNYQLLRGFISYLSYDKKHLSQSNPSSEQYAYGLGIQFFPRPHWEVQASWMTEYVPATQIRSDIGWLLVHCYL